MTINTSIPKREKEHFIKPDVMLSLISKYKDEWKKAKANSTIVTKGGYTKVDLKEWGKMEAFAMIIDDIALL